MAIAGVGGGGERDEARIEVLEIRQFRLVEREIGSGGDLARHVRARRGHHDIVAGTTRQQLGFEHLVAVVDIVGDADPGFLLEIGDRVGSDVVRPVVDVEPCFLGAGAPRQGCERESDYAQPAEDRHDCHAAH